MTTKTTCFLFLMSVGLLIVSATAGCIRAELPDSLPLFLPMAATSDSELSGGKQVEALRGTGVTDLADSSWTVWIVEFDASLSSSIIYYEPGERMLGRVELDQDGGLHAVMIEDIWLNGVPLTDLLGARILLDAKPHPAGVPGATVTADNYSAHEGNVINLGGYGVLSLGPIEVGDLQLSVVGELSEDGTTIVGDAITDYSIKPEFYGGQEVVETVRYGIVAYRD